MDTQLLLKTAMLAGEMMLRSGAETYRVEDTMHHILKTADHIEMAERNGIKAAGTNGGFHEHRPFSADVYSAASNSRRYRYSAVMP